MDVFLLQDDTGGDGGSFLVPLLMLAGLFAIFYFLLVRPNRRRRQVMESMQSELSVGDEVMTGGGLYATVAELDEKTVILETSEGIYSRYARASIVEVVSRTGDGDGEDAEPDDSTGMPDSAEPAIERRETRD